MEDKTEKTLTDLETKFGKTLTGQMNISYFTRQTAEQFLEITSDNGEEFDEEMFLEYVVSNVAEVIRNEVLYNGEKSLLREIVLLNEDGEQVV